MKEKIDLEKFICSYIKWNNIQDALKDQGLKCCNGEIVKILQESEDKQKFCEGDWITFYGGKPFKILKVESEQNGILDYLLLDQNGHDTYYNKKYVDENARLWTVQDAKNGDILVSKHNKPFIYNGIFDEESVGAYCGIDKFGNDFLIDTFSCDWSYKEGVKPATQDQRDILFMKMKDAGYEFDFEKKKLNNIEQKITVWTEKDDAYKLFAISAIEDYYDEKNPLQKDLIDWLKSFKDRVQSQPKQEWNEADEKMVKDIIAAIDTLYYHGMVNWLKSIKGRVQPQNMWKPSKEQIVALRWILNNIPYNKYKEEISGLLDKIKDL